MTRERSGAIYLDALAVELARVGIRGSLRRRILAEVEDHFTCDKEAKLGPPAQIARSFADELGTSLARRAALSAFAALALAGLLFVVAFAGARASWGPLPQLRPRSQSIGDLAVWLAVIGPQVAFAAGTLAALRAYRRRRDAVIGRQQALVLARRAGVGLLAGLASIAGIALFAMQYAPPAGGSWRTVVLVLAGAGALVLLSAAPALVRALRVQPLAQAQRGDIFADLPTPLASLCGESPWVFACVFATAVGVVIALVGVSASDPFDGIARGLADALACLAGFALLGPFLGLWRMRSARS